MGIGLKENRSRRQTEMARVIPNAGPVHPLHVVCKFKLRTLRSTGYFCSVCSGNRPRKRIIQAPRPTRGLAAGSVPADAQRVKKSPACRGLVTR